MKRHFAFMLAGSSLMGIAPLGHAQTTNASNASASSPDNSVEEIIVTARRRAESLQDVPQTVNAVTSDMIEKLSMLEFEDVQSVVPGLKLEGGLNSGASLRGVTFETFTQTSPTVEFYLNDSSIEPGILFQAIYDVGQIEVLRGPQGTLRGRAAPSGAITFSTRRPDLQEAGGYVSTTATHTEDMNFQGAFGVPLIENVLAVRVAGLYDENDGEGVESVNSSDDPSDETVGGRVSLLFQPVDSFTALLMYQYNDHTTESFGSSLLGPGAAAHPTHPANYNGPPLTTDNYRAVSEFTSRQEQVFQNATLQVDWSFAGQTLSYVGGWIDTDVDIGSAQQNTDGDTANYIIGVPGIGQMPDSVTEQFINELRLSSDERIADFFDYTIGLFTSRIRGKGLQTSPGRIFPGAFGPPSSQSPYVFNPRYVLWSEVPRTRKEDERSAFATINLHLTDKTELSLGGRYIVAEADSKTVIGTLEAFTVGPCNAPGAVPGTYPGTCDLRIAPSSSQFGVPRKDEPFIYNVSLSHRFTPDFMAYLNTGTSWRRGPGPVLGLPTCADPAYCNQFNFLGNEESESYEAGMKASLFDRRLSINLAVYQQQFAGLISQHSAIPYLGTQNAVQSAGSFIANGDADVLGVDFESSLRVTPNWSVGLAASYAEGEFDNALLPCRDSNFDGIPDANALPTTGAAWRAAGGPAGPAMCASNDRSANAPEWSASLQSEYSFPLFTGTNAFVRGLLNYYPENDNPASATNFVVDSYSLVNLYLGLRSDAGAWEVSAFAKNALDEDTLTFIGDQEVNSFSLATTFGPSGYRSFGRIAEREIGLSLRYSFGSR
jgi:iron complex outermembrane receptor protein